MRVAVGDCAAPQRRPLRLPASLRTSSKRKTPDHPPRGRPGSSIKIHRTDLLHHASRDAVAGLRIPHLGDKSLPSRACLAGAALALRPEVAWRDGGRSAASSALFGRDSADGGRIRRGVRGSREPEQLGHSLQRKQVHCVPSWSRASSSPGSKSTGLERRPSGIWIPPRCASHVMARSTPVEVPRFHAPTAGLRQPWKLGPGRLAVSPAFHEGLCVSDDLLRRGDRGPGVLGIESLAGVRSLGEAVRVPGGDVVAVELGRLRSELRE